jgi:hypothetical protein
MLDKVSVQLGPWSGYNVLAQHPISRAFGNNHLGLSSLSENSTNFAGKTFEKMLNNSLRLLDNYCHRIVPLAN